MNEYLVAVVYCVLDMLKYYFCLKYIFDIHETCKKYVVFFVLNIASLACGISFFVTGGAGICYIIPNICMLWIIFFLPKGDRLKGALYVVFAWIIMDTLTELIRVVAKGLGFKDDILLSSLSWATLNAKICAILLVFIYHGIVNVMIRKKVSYTFKSSQWGVIFVCFMGVILIVPPLEKMGMGKVISANEYIRMSFSLIMVLFLFIGVMIWQSYIVRMNFDMKEREIRYQYMVKTQAAYFEGLLKDYTEIRKFRHDMKAHVMALTELASDSKNEKMMDYLKAINVKLESSIIRSYTGNKAVDAVINELAKSMHDEKIKFEYDGVLRERNDIQDYDFCTIFYNILQNAIEASKALDESEREVSIEVKNVGDKAGIIISNKTLLKKLPENAGSRYTSKKDKDNHGFGIQNIKDVVKKYEGIYEVRVAESRYVVTIVI